MAFLDKLGPVLTSAAAEGKVNDLTGKWVDKGLDALTTRVLPKLGGPAAGIAATVADKLEANKDVANTVTHATFVTFTGYVALGQLDDAKRLWLIEQASFDERQNALLGAIGASVDAAEAREKAWDAMLRLSLDILEVAGQAAVPILLAMI